MSKTSTPPILIGDLPRAEREARKAFTEIQNNTYENKSLGKQRQAEDAFACDCTFDPAHEECTSYTACGEDADCINRLTQTECSESDCRSKSYCQNQRFQRKQYANVEIVQTEKKGNDFIYEYVGEVVSEPTLLRRMRAYNDEGVKHFYFMMLQKGEFIDATKRGGIGRFANHSCNPNCYVAKWFVGNRIRMGIFAKRNIKMDEELTFNYNVDRYGHDAQTCYCGEPNCVGFIGGKTQTEVATMDDVYIEALGLDDDEIRDLSLNIPKKGKKNKKTIEEIEEEISTKLRPVRPPEVPSLINAMRKAIGSTQPMLEKLVTRIEMTDDSATLRNILRLRGLGLMAEILREYEEEPELTLSVLKGVKKLPLVNRIKIEDVGFEDIIRPIADGEDETLSSLCREILDKWSQLEQGYRIPRRKLEDDDVQTITHITIEEESERPKKRPRVDDIEIPLELPPPAPTPSFRRVSAHVAYELTTITPLTPQPPREPTRDQLDAIIARANAAAAAMAVTSTPEPTPKKAKVRQPVDKAKEEALKEKQLRKLVGAVVVKAAGKYVKSMGKDTFKKFAEECTVSIAEKEKKSSSYATAKLDKLSEEKQAKIKKYSKDFFAKAMHKIEKKRAAKAVGSPTSSSHSQSSTSDPRRAHSSGSTSASSSTTLRGSELSIKIEDFSYSDSVNFAEDVMDEIFGKDDEENTLNATPDGDLDGDQLTVDTASALNTPVDGEALLERDHRFKFEDIAMA
ncbi:histone methyltransferase set2 [Tulasnella sp. 427]|nr:histone methyltransferase set2 [Tulasnella sp. 427]